MEKRERETYKVFNDGIRSGNVKLRSEEEKEKWVWRRGEEHGEDWDYSDRGRIWEDGLGTVVMRRWEMGRNASEILKRTIIWKKSLLI